MAAWSANQTKLAWVTDRSGPGEIWIRTPDGSDCPLVTPADFPAGTNKWFANPSLSPDGDRPDLLQMGSCGSRPVCGSHPSLAEHQSGSPSAEPQLGIWRFVVA